jgi:hypothetical protein
MNFLDLKSQDVISVVYTVHPTRSIVMSSEGSGDGGSYSFNSYEASVEIFDSGSTPGVGDRNFYDLDGYVLSQSFYSKSTISLKFNHVLTGSEKIVVNQILSTYASSSFYKTENYSSSSLLPTTTCHILNIPNTIIGSEIKKGSFCLDNGAGCKITDDGYGGLFTGSVLIGSILYEYGIAYFGRNTNFSTFGGLTSTTCYFSATNNIPMNVYICRAPKSLLNFSNNPSFTSLSGTRREITTNKAKAFATGIGLYDENFELVGIAKLANPILLDESIEYRLKLNF